MSTTPTRDFTLHCTSCTRCRSATPPHGYCPAGQRLYDAMTMAQRPGVAPAVLAWAGGTALLVTICALLFLVSRAAAPGAPALAAAGAVAPQGELVRAIAQTERTATLQHTDDTIEVVAAVGWDVLPVPAVVCVAFEGASHPIKARAAHLLTRRACGGR